MIVEHFGALRAALAATADAVPKIESWGRQLADVLGSGGRLLACGNGGSAAQAQHLTGELVGRFHLERPPFSAIALHADTSAGTAIANDYGGAELFARQVRAHGRPRDILICLSTSGSSENVCAAAKAAQQAGLTAWALTGPPPNTLASLCDDAIVVDAPSMATVQEVHLAIVHALCAVFDDALGYRTPA
jgi:D-sedoheptulose 7-phosphate isomerase